MVTNPSYFWSELQKQALSQAYQVGGLPAAVSILPEKNRSAIATEAHRLGLTKPRPRKHKQG